jgi:hypothetical protein
MTQTIPEYFAWVDLFKLVALYHGIAHFQMSIHEMQAEKKNFLPESRKHYLFINPFSAKSDRMTIFC